MSQSTETTRPDPLLDAYRQASAHEGARAGANVRAAVLAHARVAAQSSTAAVSAINLSNATRAAPAANESRPMWRLAAGVVIGLVGVWIFQLTRPSVAPDTAVAVADVASAANVASVTTAPSAPQANKARAAEPAKTVTPASPEPAKPEAAVVVAALPIAKERAAQRSSAAREPPTDGAGAEQNLAMGKALSPKEKTNQPAAFAGASAAAVAAVAAAPSVAAASVADEAVAAIRNEGNEVVIASADTRKSARLQPRAEAPSSSALATASPSSPPPAAPNAFPAQASGVAVAAAPIAPTARPSPAIAAAPNDAASPVRLSEAEQQMFKAARAGDAVTLRTVITRGVNVNAKDERGRSALVIARGRGDAETIKVLQAAGAR